MANSLKAKISKLRYERHITEEEYQELIKKLDGHDKQIRADELEYIIKRGESILESKSLPEQVVMGICIVLGITKAKLEELKGKEQ